MIRNAEQLAEDAAATEFLKNRRAEFDQTITPEVAARTASFVPGGKYTSPELKASLGLSGIPVDPQMVHAHSVAKARENFQFNNDYWSANSNTVGQKATPKPQGDIFQLLIREQKLAANGTRNKVKVPDWYDTVDPGGYWRNLPVPQKTQVKNAWELTNLTEPQLLKFLVQNGGTEGLRSIPQMYNEVSSTNPNPQLLSYETGKPVPGTGGAMDALKQKFPNFGKLATQYEAMTPDTSVIATAGKVAGLALKGTLDFVSTPFKFAGFLAPDFFKPFADVPRTAIRGVATGTLAAGQLSKNMIEYIATHGGIDPLTGMPAVVGSATEKDIEDFKSLVIKGNVLSQTANEIFTGQKVDLGTGFFAGGSTLEKAIAAHDEGLPKINGRTWTAGNAVIQPLIRENWIDADGFVAKTISGLTDAVFTVGTDFTTYVDPVQKLMKAFNLSHTSATVLLNAKKADKVREAWAAERKLQGLSTTITDSMEMIFDAVAGVFRRADGPVDAEDIAKMGGIVPPNTQLPAEVEAVIDDMVRKELDGKTLAAMDAPPDDVSHVPAPGSKEEAYAANGLIRDGEGVLRPDPMIIDNMPFTATGRRTLKRLTSYKNSGELYDAFLGNIPPGAAVQIQDIVDAARKVGQEVDLSAVHKVLVDGVLSADPFYGVSEIPGLGRQLFGQTGKQIAHWVAGESRQLGVMPGSVYFHFGDPLSSVNDMNKMMIVMNVPTADRHIMLDKAQRVIATGGSGAKFKLANDWMKTIVAPALRKSGVDEDWIEIVTSWAGWDNDIKKWTMNAIGDGYPTTWLDDSNGILRSVDFLNNGFLMVAPDQLKKVINETTNFYQLLKPIRDSKLYRESPLLSKGIEKALNQQITTRLTHLQNQWLKPVAMGAPLPIRMISKIIPDELLRVMITGNMNPMALKALMSSGHVNYTTHGVIIKSAKEIHETFPIVEHMEELTKKLSKAIAKEDGPLASSLLEELKNIEKKHGTLDSLKEQIRINQARMEQDLPGANKKVAESIEGIMGKELKDGKVLRYVRKKVFSHAYRGNNPIENAKWAEGTAVDIARMNASPEYRAVADIIANGTPQDIQNIGQRFFNGDLKPILDDYRLGLGNESATNPLTSVGGVSDWAATIVDDIAHRTGMDEKLLEAVSKGTFDGSTIHAGSALHVWETKPEIKKYILEEFINNPKAPTQAPFFSMTATSEVEETDRLFTRGFNLYRDASAKAARTPFGSSEKWKRIIELMPVMSPSEAQKMWSAIDKTDAPSWLKDSIKRALPDAKGTATRKQIELLGEMHGQQRVSDILYDYSKQSYFGSKHNLMFGFFNAWVEQWSVWARMLAQNPSVIGKAQNVKTGLEEVSLPEWWQKDDKGLIYKDNNGQQRVALPFSHKVYSMFGLNAQESLSTKNLSFLGQAYPGFFGFGSVAVDSAAPTVSALAGARNLFFPYGDPSAGALTRVADYFVPHQFQSVIGGAASTANRTFGGSTQMFANIQASMVGDNNVREKAGLVNAVLTNIAVNTDGAPVSPELRDRLMNDANTKADLLGIIKGFINIFSPAKSSTEYFTEVAGEDIPVGRLMDDLRKWTTETGDYQKAVTKMLDKYGTGAWIYLAGSSSAYPGMQATKEWATWQRGNAGIVNKYKNVGSFLGPQEGEYVPGVFSTQRSAGYRPPNGPLVKMEEGLENLAWNLYHQAQEEIFAIGESEGYTPAQTATSAYYKSEMKKKSQELKTQFPMWSPKATSGESERRQVKQLDEVTRMVKDKKVIATPAGAAMKEYWDYRTKQVTDMLKAHPDMANDTWKSSTRSTRFRQDLINKGEEIADKTPEFQAVWENVLSREYDPPELGE